MIEIAAPTTCPDCSKPIIPFTEEKSNILTHWCENKECPGRIADMLTFVADRKLLEIEGLGPELAALLAKGGYVVTLADLVEFCKDLCLQATVTSPDVLAGLLRKSGFPAAATLKMAETVERAKTASWDRWLAALGIPMIGVRLGKVLAKELNLGSNDMAKLPKKLNIPEERQIEGIGFHKRAELRRYSEDQYFIYLCHRLAGDGVRPTPIEQPVVAEGAPLAGVTFCITGEFFDIGSRPYITDHLVKLGAVAKTGVSKKCSHLLVGTEPGRTKLEKATALKIQQVDEVWVKEVFTKNGIACAGSDLAMDWAN